MLEIRMGIKKSVYEQQQKFEGFAIVNGVKKELTQELIADLQKKIVTEKQAGRKVDYTKFWLNDNGNPLQSC